MIFFNAQLPDALDYAEKWLRDSAEALRDPSSPPAPQSVHNHAYLRLLKWDHATETFPEVRTSCTSTLSILILVVVACSSRVEFAGFLQGPYYTTGV